jgi:glycine/D-amino acid oxidase-like deaminating enzyme
LTLDRIPDVVVVGGGVIGCAVAFELAKRSARVLLLDKSLPGRASSASAGGLWPVGEAIGLGCGVIYHTAAKGPDLSAAAHPEPLGPVFRDFLVRSNALFPDLAAELRDSSGIDVEYRPSGGLLFLIYDDEERATVQALTRGLPAEMHLDILDPQEVRRLEPRLTRDLAGGVLLSGEDQVNPMLLAEAFKRAAVKRGAAFRHDARVTALRCSDSRVRGVEVGGEFIPCGSVVNAAGSWSAALAATAGLKLPVFPVRGQIVLTEALPETLNCCLSTTSSYLLQKAHGEVLIGSTTEKVGFDVSVTPAAIQSLCRGAVRAVPMLKEVGVKRVWAGLRPGTPDELPILGSVEGLEGYLNATGGFRTGIVASPLTGRVVAQAAVGEQPAFPLKPFLLGRFAAAVSGAAGVENLPVP